MKRELWIPVVVIALTALFGLACGLVWLTRGRNGYLLRKKLAIGGLLLSLGGSAACGLFEPTVTCYDPIMPNRIQVVDPSGAGNYAELTVNLAEGTSLHGTLAERQGAAFSFQVSDGASEVWQREDLQADDGAFDEADETFTIVLRNDLTVGDYQLDFYTRSAADLDADSDAYPWQSYALHVIDQ